MSSQAASIIDTTHVPTNNSQTTKQNVTENAQLKGNGNDGASKSPIPNPSSESIQVSNNSTNLSNQEKKSYKIALVKDLSTPVDKNASIEKPKENSSLNTEQKIQQQTTKNSLEQITETKKADNSQQSNEESSLDPNNADQRGKGTSVRRNFNNSTGRTESKSSGPWKKNLATKKKRKDEDETVEPLADLSAWPSLDQIKLPETSTTSTKEKKKESPRNTEESSASIPSTEVTESTDPNENKEPTDVPKKKGSFGQSVNWVPFHDIETSETPRHYYSGRGGRGMGRNPRERRDGQNSRPPYRNSANQGSNPNYRGSRRGGRGGFRGQQGSQGYVPNAGPIYYSAPLEGEALRVAVSKQMEYYFSVENLCKDLYLRGAMDEEGWVLLSLVANFNRLKVLSSDLLLIAESIQSSSLVECKEDKVRKKDDWKIWLMPKVVRS